MENESTLDDTATSTGTSAESDIESSDVVEELLIEEISIDGMCGVY